MSSFLFPCRQSVNGNAAITKASRLPGVGRIHFKGSQTHLSATDRRENVEGAFRLKPSHWWQRKETIEGRHVLLIDDVVTTGATLIACAQELMKAKPRQISILALAYTRSQ